MNVERWLKSRNPSWLRLEELLSDVDRTGLSSLKRQQLQELGRLYRSASADLSRARAMKLSQDVQIYLNNLVVKAHNQVYQRHASRWAHLLDFLLTGFPQLVKENILYVAASGMVLGMPAVLSYCLVQEDIHFAQLEFFKGHPIVSDDMWYLIEKRQMWTDPVQNYSATVSSLIATNNIKVAILAFVLGITFGAGTAFVLCQNGLMLGTIFGICKIYGMAWQLLAFIAPHGVLELSAIVISGAGGLMLGKALLFPGEFSRLDALRLQAKTASKLFVGCIPLLVVAGLVEGFISPRTDISNQAKFMVSLATCSLLLLYFRNGKQAKRGAASLAVTSVAGIKRRRRENRADGAATD